MKTLLVIFLFMFYTVFWLFVCAIYKSKTIEYCRTVGIEVIGNYVIQCNVTRIE